MSTLPLWKVFCGRPCIQTRCYHNLVAMSGCTKWN